jgi:hypothetical protein
MCKNNVRKFKEVANIVSYYAEKPEELLERLKENNIRKIIR